MGILFYGFQFTEENTDFILQRKTEVYISFLPQFSRVFC